MLKYEGFCGNFSFLMRNFSLHYLYLHNLSHFFSISLHRSPWYLSYHWLYSMEFYRLHWLQFSFQTFRSSKRNNNFHFMNQISTNRNSGGLYGRFNACLSNRHSGYFSGCLSNRLSPCLYCPLSNHLSIQIIPN